MRSWKKMVVLPSNGTLILILFLFIFILDLRFSSMELVTPVLALTTTLCLIIMALVHPHHQLPQTVTLSPPALLLASQHI